jgi:transcriptional accessory protein Tex/SPT6
VATSTAAPTPEKKILGKKEMYCHGRKPVTDYEVQKTYPATVKYIKPTLGAFFDMGCHSDAFCHISEVADTFVKDVNEVLTVDMVVQATVLEVDRIRKRLTITLRGNGNGAEGAMTEGGGQDGETKRVLPEWKQRENKMLAEKVAEEKKAKEEHREFLRNQGEQPSKKDKDGEDDGKDESPPKTEGNSYQKESTFKAASPVAVVPSNSSWKGGQDNSWHGGGGGGGGGQPKTGAELKRERKLARRADRRAQEGGA